MLQDWCNIAENRQPGGRLQLTKKEQITAHPLACSFCQPPLCWSVMGHSRQSLAPSVCWRWGEPCQNLGSGSLPEMWVGFCFCYLFIYGGGGLEVLYYFRTPPRLAYSVRRLSLCLLLGPDNTGVPELLSVHPSIHSPIHRSIINPPT